MHDHAILLVAAIAGVWSLLIGYLLWEMHNAALIAEDAGYDVLRGPGLGHLEDTPVFDQLCLERLDAQMEEW